MSESSEVYEDECDLWLEVTTYKIAMADKSYLR